MPAPLLIGSSEPFSGKSAVALGLGRLLARQGVSLRFGKPLATMPTGLGSAGLPVGAEGPLIDEDTRFLGSFLGLAPEQLIPSLHCLDPASAHQRLLAGDLEPGEGFAALCRALGPDPAGPQEDQLVMLEGAGSLSEGLLFGLSLPQLISRSEELEVPVLKVEHDTLTTVEVIEAAIGHVRLQEAVKASYAVRLVEENCRFERLFERLRLPVRL